MRQLIKGRVVTTGIDVIVGFDVTVAVVVDIVVPGSLIFKAVFPYRGYSWQELEVEQPSRQKLIE